MGTKRKPGKIILSEKVAKPLMLFWVYVAGLSVIIRVVMYFANGE